MSGTYFLTAETFYTGAAPTPAQDQQTMVIDATAGTLAIVDTQTGPGTNVLAATFTTSGSTLLLTPTCGTGADGGIVDVPGAQPKSGDTYTATSTTFTIYSVPGNDVLVYTKQ